MIRRRDQEEYAWAAGSYIDLFIASGITQVLFGITLYWMLVVGPDETNFVYSISGSASYSPLPMLGIGILAGVGWMMALILGMGFDIIPLNFGFAPFDKTLISTVAAFNIGGQVLIMIGIFSGDTELLGKFGLMGVTLLGAQLVMLGPLAFAYMRGRAQSKDTVGPWSYGSIMGLPVIGIMTILVWMFADNEAFRNLYWAVLIDSFWVMIAFTLILGQLQGRVGIPLMEHSKLHLAFKGFIVLCIVHIGLVYAFYSGVITDYRVNASFALPLIWVFVCARPDRVWKRVIAGETCSAQILSAHSWLLLTILVSICEGFTDVNTDMFFSRFMVLLGISTQALWGAAHWLHEDHKETPLHERGEPWVRIVAMCAALFGIVYLFSETMGANLSYVQEITLLTIGLLILAYLSFLYWMMDETLVHFEDWSRIPMYYGDKHLDLSDPYEVGVVGELEEVITESE